MQHAGKPAAPRNCPALPRPIDWPRMFEARFQSFDDPQPAQTGPRVQALRAELARRGLSRLDPAARRPAPERIRAALRGAAGLADRLHRLGRDNAWCSPTRPRCSSMAATRCRRETQVDTSVFTIVPIADTTPERWLEQNLPSGAKLGYDPWLHTAEGAERLARACANAGATLVPAEPNPIDTIWTDRPAPPLGAGGAARSALRRRSGRRQARQDPRRDRQACAPTRWWCPIRTPWPGPSTSAAPTSRIRRCRSPSPSCRSEGRPTLYIDSAKLSNAVRHKLEEATEVREPAAFIGDLEGARRSASHRAARSGDRRRRAVAHHRRGRRQGDARARSDRDDEGDQEHRSRSTARARRTRRDGAAVTRFLAWFDREAPNGPAHRDRRGRGAGKLSPRHRPAQGRVVPEHLRRGPGRRHRALSRDALDQPQDRAGRTVPDRFRRAVRGRHHRHHPHRRGRRADAGDARALHPGAQGPHRHRARGVSRGHRRLAARSVRAPGAVGRTASISTTAPATASAAICRCTKARRASPSSATRRSSAA